MAGTVNEVKVVTLEQLNYVKQYVDNEDEGAFKSVGVTGNSVSFYASKDKSGTALFTIDLPEELVLDLTKSTLVSNFTWSDATYPGSTNPNLDGKPVFVLAVKGDTSVTYSFVAMSDLVKTLTGESTATVTTVVENGKIKANVTISAQAGNALSAVADGLFVPGVSADEGNILEKRESGYYVPSTIEGNATITFATDQDVRNLFAIV